MMDSLFINPGDRKMGFQDLGKDETAIKEESTFPVMNVEPIFIDCLSDLSAQKVL